jgi:uncharacterized protein (TIGR02302 family)
VILNPRFLIGKYLGNRLRRMRRIGWLAVAWENITLAFWWPACWAALFAALWLLQIPGIMGKSGNAIAFIVFAAGGIYFLWCALGIFIWPDRDMIDRRLERASGLEHRPLTLLEDQLANPDRETARELWEQGQTNAAGVLHRLRAFFPRPILAKQDPHALRAFVLILLATGFIVAGPQWKERLHSGLTPFSYTRQTAVSDDIALWITPPEYTGLPQIMLQGAGRYKNAIDVPADSIIKARVRGWFGTPELVMGETRLRLTHMDKKNWSAESPMVFSDTIEIKQGFLTRLRLPVNFITDQPPEIALRGEPAALEKGTLQIPLAIKDDYGARTLTMKMTLDPSIAEDPPLGAPVEETRNIITIPKMDTELQPVYDLSWHPWAGLPVVIEITAKDYIGQSVQLAPIRMTLPERPFFHPVAKKLVELRKRLIWTPGAAIPNASYELERIMASPSEYEGDIVAFLSLRSMASRLYYDPTEKSALAVIPQLWDTALRIEEGNLTMASRDLHKAQQALQKLLDDPNATDEQIAEAMEQLQQAMGQYFREMARELQKQMAAQGGEMPMMDPEALQNMLNGEDIQAFLDQLRAQALSGDRDSAQQMLSHLQQMMDGLNSSAGGGGVPPEMQEMMEQMGGLKKLIEKQQVLLDETQGRTGEMSGHEEKSYPDFLPADPEFMQQWGGEDQMPPPPSAPQDQGGGIQGPDMSGARERQEGLRKDLGDLMLEADEALGEIPEGMQKSEQEMRGSSEQLGANRPDLSAPHQQQAIDHLKDAMESMNKQMAQMMKQMTMLSLGMGPLDPLGRPLDNEGGPSLMPGSKVKIPDKAERKRAQEILRTLRQRSGELDRPDYELEYYQRLMKQF